MAAIVKNHVHKYRRSKKDKDTYFCAKPDCFLKIDKDMLVGKMCACNETGCDNEFELTFDLIRRAAPKCALHRNDKTARVARSAKDLDLSALFENEEELEELPNG
jgi:hypothetical protein